MVDLNTKITLGHRQHIVRFSDAVEALQSARVRGALGLAPKPETYKGREVTLRELLLMATLSYSPEAQQLVEALDVPPLALSDLGLPLRISGATAVLLKSTPIVDAINASERGWLGLGQNSQGAIERVPQAVMRGLPRIFTARCREAFRFSYPTEAQAAELAARHEGTTMGQENDTIGGLGIRWFFLADQEPAPDQGMISLWSLSHGGVVRIPTNRAVKPYYGAILVNAA
jgi:hypothetical protein